MRCNPPEPSHTLRQWQVRFIYVLETLHLCFLVSNDGWKTDHMCVMPHIRSVLCVLCRQCVKSSHYGNVMSVCLSVCPHVLCPERLTGFRYLVPSVYIKVNNFGSCRHIIIFNLRHRKTSVPVAAPHHFFLFCPVLTYRVSTAMCWGLRVPRTQKTVPAVV